MFYITYWLVALMFKYSNTLIPNLQYEGIALRDCANGLIGKRIRFGVIIRNLLEQKNLYVELFAKINVKVPN